MKWMVIKRANGTFAGFQTKASMDKLRRRNEFFYPELGETLEEFEGPELKTNEDFYAAQEIAESMCVPQENLIFNDEDETLINQFLFDLDTAETKQDVDSVYDTAEMRYSSHPTKYLRILTILHTNS
jgi:hypothetical protein